MAIQVEPGLRAVRETGASLDRIELGSTRRVGRLMARILSQRPKLCLHRARSYTEVFRETEGEPLEIRYGKAFARALHDLPVVIDEDELIVGASYCKIRAGGFYPESNGAWLENQVDGLATREWDPFDISPQEVREVKEMMEYWRGRTLYDLWSRHCPPDLVNRVIGKGWADSLFGTVTHGCHFTPPFERILSDGLRWYEDRVRKSLDELDGTDPQRMDKENFYRGILLVIRASRDFAAKYSRKAREMAEQETQPGRKEELLRMAQALERVPYEGARSFYEALESVWFTYVLVNIEGTGPGYGLGRFDQYMYPFYRADLEKGALTREEAQELVECLYIKLNGNCKVFSNENARAAPGYEHVQTINVGGVDAAGRDATNELSFLCLEAAGSLRTVAPDIALLWHPRETPYALKMKGAELNARGFAVPKYFSTDAIKHELLSVGFSLEEANVGWIKACSGPCGPGCKQYGHNAASYLNLPLALEAVLFNGRKRSPGQPGSGELLGVETGDCRRLETFEQLMNAVKVQLTQQVSDAHEASSWTEWVQARHFPVLLQSAFTESCIERGRGAEAGGADIYVGPGMAVTGGLATLADSLAAIKKLVYEDRVLAMAELLKAVDANFEGYETVRGMLINKAPKYGNDIDYVDDIARDIFDHVTREASKHITPLGNRNVSITAFPMSHVMEGARTWATPDGRKAGTPLSAHVDPVDGMDVNGPAANLKSATKLEQDRQSGCTHNLYLVNVDGTEQLHRLIDLVDLFMSRGGHHLQFNCQSKEVFIDAQKHPENYRGLMVRVSGYVAYFTELPKEVQDHIIGRSVHYV
ncbi:MAG: hypothetical protein HYX92_03290 [Chloroflexi bacterium]|nr:hypothetical protein [Chloroflexota bacterium]